MEPILTGGGAAALVVALAYVGRLALDWSKERRDGPSQRITATVSDAATANALLLASLKEEREEVQRLSGEVQELRVANADLYERMRQQRREYEAEVGELRKQLGDLSERLETLQAKLRAEPSESD